jgi:hypothetical protein
MAELFGTPHLTQVLEELGREVAEQYKNNLRESGHATRPDHLINSIETRVVVDDKSYKVVMDLNDYWKYLENGTEPHWPPVDAIRSWISYKPVLPRPGKDGRLPTPNQLAFLIGRKIAREGTTGTHDFEEARDETVARWEQRIRAALVEDVRTWLTAIVTR